MGEGEFLSTPSARRATVDIKTHADRDDISIHALREEGDHGGGDTMTQWSISIHALREEGDNLLHEWYHGGANFYPRPPRGGRRRCHRCPAHGWQISIHALREEGDAAAQKLQLPAGRFLSTPSARRATRPDCPGKLVHRISIHALREEGDKDAQNEYSKGGTFLSTPSARRATFTDLGADVDNAQFLSTPSARRATLEFEGFSQGQAISIHALREEGDANADLFTGGGKISIHALREEGDPDNKTGGKGLGYFYPRPPRGGRHAGQRRGRERGHISIHALREEGDSRQASSTTLKSNFYPRPPRGGRRSRYDNNDTGDAFLSTPSARRATSSLFHANASEAISIHALREEGDAAAPTECLCAKISIHALREEGDL